MKNKTPFLFPLSCLLFLTSCSPSADDSLALSPQPSALPLRLVSLAPNLTEMLCAMDARPLLVGRTDACDFPPEAAAIPSTGAFGEPDLERLLALRPTHVVYADLLNKSIPGRLRRLNIDVRHIPCERLDDIAPALRALGEIARREAAAETLAARLETRLAELRANADTLPVEQRPGVFLLMWNDPLMTVGGGSFITDLFHLAGARNLAAETPAPYFNASPEWAVSLNPGILVSFLDAPPGTLQKLLAQSPGWSATRAIRENRVIEDLPLNLLLRPGPRVLDAVEAIRQALEEHR